ncbi:MAG TPA: metal ABC transporter substrate-binding protein [Acidimicrobiia bacterium]
MILIIRKGLRIASLATALAVGACAPAVSDGSGVHIVATTGILGDVVAQLVPEEHVEVLIPAGADPHEFRASPRQAELIAGADLVVANGLGLEEGLSDLLAAQATPVLDAGCYADPLPLPGEDPQPCAQGNDGRLDPHFWLDPLRMGLVVEEIAARLSSFDAGAVSRAAAYTSELEAVHDAISRRLAALPSSSRRVVTNHDFLRYLAARYSLEVVGAVTPGGSTLSEPSASHLAELVELIDLYQIGQIFVEITEPARLAGVVAQEADHPVELVELYVESLGEAGSGADTYLGLLRTNLDRIVEALT